MCRRRRCSQFLHFTRHRAAKTAKPEQFIDNSILAELEKSGFVNQLYGR
jgi:hypothetical protein